MQQVLVHISSSAIGSDIVGTNPSKHHQPPHRSAVHRTSKPPLVDRCWPWHNIVEPPPPQQQAFCQKRLEIPKRADYAGEERAYVDIENDSLLSSLAATTTLLGVISLHLVSTALANLRRGTIWGRLASRHLWLHVHCSRQVARGPTHR